MTISDMCWNREVSWVTGLTATGLSAYLLVVGKGNDIPIALLSMAIALMQFAEALMWDSDPRGGHLGILALLLQPLALVAGIAWVYSLPAIYVGLFVIAWCLTAIPLAQQMWPKEWPAKPGCRGHLQWSFLDPFLASPFAVVYWTTMLGAWLLMKPFQEGLRYTAMAWGTLGLTWVFFPGEWGSLWCFLANALPLGRLLM